MPDECPRPANARAERLTQLGQSRATRLQGAEDAVARVAETRPDVAALVELAVDRGRPDRDLGMRRLDCREPLRSGDEADQGDPGRARELDPVQRVDGTAPGGEHRIDDVDV